MRGSQEADLRRKEERMEVVKMIRILDVGNQRAFFLCIVLPRKACLKLGLEDGGIPAC